MEALVHFIIGALGNFDPLSALAFIALWYIYNKREKDREDAELRYDKLVESLKTEMREVMDAYNEESKAATKSTLEMTNSLNLLKATLETRGQNGR